MTRDEHFLHGLFHSFGVAPPRRAKPSSRSQPPAVLACGLRPEPSVRIGSSRRLLSACLDRSPYTTRQREAPYTREFLRSPERPSLSDGRPGGPGPPPGTALS